MYYIIFNGELDIRKGGAAGYLANLKVGLNSINSNFVKIITKEKLPVEIQGNKKVTLKSKLKDYTISKLNNKFRDYYETNYIFNYNKRNKHIRKILSKYNITDKDILHFHNIYDYYYASSLFPNNLKILTTHTPESMAIEHVERLKSQLKTDYEFKLTYKKISEIEKNVFESCKYFMYPSEESLEPYYETISNFGDMIENKNIYYNMTGCKKLTKEGSKKDFCKKNHIDEKSFIVLFVGRHNNVKGYKVFCDTFNKISNLVRNITFVSAGIGNIKSPNHKNFVDIGWTEDPGSLISASDLFVLPNNRTFFDLIMLEVLSLGKPILASNTGGNKTISKLDSGVVLFNRGDENDLSNKILELKNDKELLEKLGNKNLSLYNSYFTLEKFAERYNELAIKMSDVALSLKNNRD